MAWKDVFTDNKNEFSWRKALTALAAFLFLVSVLGYLFGLRQLPSEYILVISGVFTFYFLKSRMSGQNGSGTQENVPPNGK